MVLRLILLMIIIVTTSQASGEPNRHECLCYSVKLNDGLLSVNAREAPLVSILEQAGKLAGFQLIVYGNIEESVSQVFTDLPIAEALKHLVGNHSAAFTTHRNTITQIALFGAHVENGKKKVLTGEGLQEYFTPLSLQKEFLPDFAHEDPAIRRVAIQQTYGLDTAVAINVLRSVILEDEAAPVRAEALTVLLNIGGAEAYDTIILALGDHHTAIRSQAIEALVALDEDRAVQHLGQILLGDPDPELRLKVLHLLANHNYNHEVASALIATAIDDSNDSVRAAARKAIEY